MAPAGSLGFRKIAANTCPIIHRINGNVTSPSTPHRTSQNDMATQSKMAASAINRILKNRCHFLTIWPNFTRNVGILNQDHWPWCISYKTCLALDLLQLRNALWPSPPSRILELAVISPPSEQTAPQLVGLLRSICCTHWIGVWMVWFNCQHDNDYIEDRSQV